MFKDLLQILPIVSCTVCLLGSFLLFLRSDGYRSRLILAWSLLLQGVFFVFQIVTVRLQLAWFVNRDFFSPSSLIIGNFFVIIFMLYIIEVVRPGWLSLKRFCLMMTPYLGIVCLYFIGLFISGQSIISLSGFGDLRENLFKFNVWYRFLILFSVIFYIAYYHRFTYRYIASYTQWYKDNFASTTDMDITWLRYYFLGTIFITISYTGVLFLGNPINFVIHNLIISIFSFFVSYKAVFHINPYPEGYFRTSLTKTESDTVNPVSSENDYFSSHLEDYKQKVENWLQQTQPYLRSDFKLLDVREILPLNRSYLSRVFNEGFGTSFSQVIQHYRLEESKRMLKDCLDKPINQIALECGFGSASAFHHVFTKHFGLTPKQYRVQLTK